ncbi:hypothetical protein CHELA40_10447 [Chelatococcus asaccharovorans]|nr:hypothetical protein CHELA40_10447 [Chelatococcus asaccharovorans]CAH1686683.1 hypothetical protein CHELA17_65160 [Chelatococcus asaccharovorans]
MLRDILIPQIAREYAHASGRLAERASLVGEGFLCDDGCCAMRRRALYCVGARSLKHGCKVLERFRPLLQADRHYLLCSMDWETRDWETRDSETRLGFGSPELMRQAERLAGNYGSASGTRT